MTNIGQALTDDTYQELPVIANPDVGGRMACQLQSASALGCQETECNHFPLPVIHPLLTGT